MKFKSRLIKLLLSAGIHNWQYDDIIGEDSIRTCKWMGLQQKLHYAISENQEDIMPRWVTI